MMIVAEIGANHNGSLARALQLIDAAKECGADCVKFQSYQAEQMVLDHSYTIESGPWAGERLIDLYRRAETPRNWHPTLYEHARSIGIEPFSSVFSREDVDFLETLDCPRYKISSFELPDRELIEHAAATGKPIIISTGMATEQEIDEASAFIDYANLTLLHCISAYPAVASEYNIATMAHLSYRFLAAVGLSDHTIGTTAARTATAMGATMIEKHLTIRRADGGPDAAFSSEPREFADMVVAVHETLQALGEIRLGPREAEQGSVALRRSLWWARDVEEGQIIQRDDLVTARPSKGRAPAAAGDLIGTRATMFHRAGTPA